MKVTSNEQNFQSIYLVKTDNWEETIVFHDPIFKTEPVGIAILKSVRLENTYGVVFGGPVSLLRRFRETMRDVDKKEELGKEDLESVFSKLLNEAEKCGLSARYIQMPENAAESFFDPVTKRKIVELGPKYFDPSLPTLEESEELLKSRMEAESNVPKVVCAKKYGNSYSVVISFGEDVFVSEVKKEDAERIAKTKNSEKIISFLLTHFDRRTKQWRT